MKCTIAINITHSRHWFHLKMLVYSNIVVSNMFINISYFSYLSIFSTNHSGDMSHHNISDTTTGVSLSLERDLVSPSCKRSSLWSSPFYINSTISFSIICLLDVCLKYLSIFPFILVMSLLSTFSSYKTFNYTVRRLM